MNALQAMRMQLNVARTENGDLAYKSTGSVCLDFFSLCGGMRRNLSDLSKLFVKAYAENPAVAIKILFYMRNIRGGLGERNSFRVLLKELGDFYPETAKKVLYAVPEYGRWDDVLVLIETSVKDDAVALIKTQIEKDQSAMAEGREVSLLGKWLPSINTSRAESVSLAKQLMKALGMKAVEYRKLCSALRKEIKILENNLRTRDYTFDYSKQPSQAMLRYKKAFIRNDEERYKSFFHLKKIRIFLFKFFQCREIINFSRKRTSAIFIVSHDIQKIIAIRCLKYKCFIYHCIFRQILHFNLKTINAPNSTWHIWHIEFFGHCFLKPNFFFTI